MALNGKVTVHYFPIRGRGEPIRLFLAELDVKFEAATPANWPEMKTNGLQDGSLPFGQIPMVEFANGLKLVQMNPILRYIGAVSGRDGNTAEEKAVIDMYVEGVEDWRSKYVELIYKDKVAPERFEAYKEFITKAPTGKVHLWEEILRRSGGEYLVKGAAAPSSADISLFGVVDDHLHLIPELLDNFPLLKSWYGRMKARPNIAAYLASDPAWRKSINANGLG